MGFGTMGNFQELLIANGADVNAKDVKTGPVEKIVIKL